MPNRSIVEKARRAQRQRREHVLQECFKERIIADDLKALGFHGPIIQGLDVKITKVKTMPARGLRASYMQGQSKARIAGLPGAFASGQHTPGMKAVDLMACASNQWRLIPGK